MTQGGHEVAGTLTTLPATGQRGAHVDQVGGQGGSELWTKGPGSEQVLLGRRNPNAREASAHHLQPPGPMPGCVCMGGGHTAAWSGQGATGLGIEDLGGFLAPSTDFLTTSSSSPTYFEHQFLHLEDRHLLISGVLARVAGGDLLLEASPAQVSKVSAQP